MNAEPYTSCPKCGYEPLPIDQQLPVACPGCGVILAKLAAMDNMDTTIEEQESEEKSGDGQHIGWRQQFVELLTYVPPRVELTAFWVRVALLVAFAIWGLQLIALDYRTGEMMNSFLHGPLLVFHEAGHVIFRPFGEFVTILGGSLAQLLMPAIIALAFLIRNRDPFGAAMATWFLGVSLLDLAPYIYDSLHPQLVLLGGHTGEEGGHDWIYLLSEMGVLQRSQFIGAFVHKLGVIGILLSIGWAGWILAKQKNSWSTATNSKVDAE